MLASNAHIPKLFLHSATGTLYAQNMDAHTYHVPSPPQWVSCALAPSIHTMSPPPPPRVSCALAPSIHTISPPPPPRVSCAVASSTFLTSIVMEADSDGILTQLLLKKVLLVKEEDEGCVCKPPIVQDGAKQPQCLIHTVLQAREQSTCKR